MPFPPRPRPSGICTFDIALSILAHDDAHRTAHDRRQGGRAPAGRDRGRRAGAGLAAAPGGDRPGPRRQHDAGARGAGHAPAGGARAAAPAARRRGLPAQRRRPARALRDPRGARSAGRGEGGGGVRARLGPAADLAPGRDARRAGGRTLHRAQPALPHDAVRALRPAEAGGDDRRAARHLELLPAHLPRGRGLPGGAPGRRAPGDPGRLRRPRPRARRRGHARAPAPHRRARGRAPVTRILTTHVGSLPRPEDLIRTMFAKQEGVPVDPAALEERTREAVAEVVRRQAEAGVDVVSDGEMGKPSYVTYVADRLEGFGGTSQPLTYADLVPFPALQQKVFGDPGRSRRRTPACDAPVKPRDGAGARADIEHMTAALAGVGVHAGFMNAASPGVIALFFRNDHYATREEYVHAIAEAMRPEYEAIAAAGLLVQIDCPDLAMGRHIQFADRSLEEFRREAALNIEALNAATANIPPERMRIHVCWGNYEGPHHCDVPFADIVDLVLGARPAAIAFEAANPRHAHEWRIFEDVKLPAGKTLIPGVIESKSNFIEHPELIAQRIERYARLVGAENVQAGSDCGYGTWVGQAAVDPGVVWAKLRALAEGAQRVS